MQIVFLSAPMTFILCFVGWFILQLGAALLCLRIPDKWLSPERYLFRTHNWEKDGRLYRILRVHRWKRLLPDGGAVLKSGYRKKKITDYSMENMSKFAIESCRAELTHLLAILPFWVFGFIGPPSIILYMLIYALIVNLPCMIAQRYNRPRVMALIKQMKMRKDMA